MRFWKNFGFGQKPNSKPFPNNAAVDSAPDPDGHAIAGVLDLIVDLPNQALAILIYRTTLRLLDSVKTTSNNEWAAESLDTTVSALRNGLGLGAPSRMLLPPAAPLGASVILSALLTKYQMNAYSFAKSSNKKDLMGDFVDALSDAESIVSTLHPAEPSKLSQLIQKDGLLLRDLFASADNGATAEKITALGDLWNPITQNTATLESIGSGYIAVLVDGDIVDETNLRATVMPKLCDLTGLTQSELADQSQIQVLRDSGEEIDRIEQGEAVGIVIAMELSISLGDPDITTLFSDGKLQSDEHVVKGDSTGARFGIVVLHRKATE